MDTGFLDKYSKVALVTGATGLVGQAVVKELRSRGIGVVAQGFSTKPDDCEGQIGIKGDFSSVSSVRNFINANRELLKKCSYLVNNYGPLTWKQSRDLKTEDFIADFQGNFLTAVEITGFMLGTGKFEGVVNIGFEHIGEIKGYKKILSYGVAKNSLLLYIESMRLEWKEHFFSFVSPSTVKGAEFEAAGSRPVMPESVAHLVADCIENRENRNFIIDYNGIRG